VSDAVSHRILRSLVSVPILLLSTAADGKASDAMTKERVLAEYPKALAALEARFSHANGEGMLLSLQSRPEHGSIVERRKVGFSFSSGNGRLTLTRTDAPGAHEDSSGKKVVKYPKNYQTVVCYNDKYSFEITKEDVASEYIIRMLEAGPRQSRRSIHMQIDFAVRCAMNAQLDSISTMLTLPEFRIDRVAEESSSTGRGKLRIDFSIAKKPDPARKTSVITSGWLVVSPAEQWVLYEYGSILTTWTLKKLTYIGHVEYKKGSDGEPEPVRCSYRLYRGDYKADPALSDPGVVAASGQDFEFTHLSFADRPAGDFTLTAFGLPEFNQIASATRPRSSSWWIWAGAAVVGVAAFALRRISRRPAT